MIEDRCPFCGKEDCNYDCPEADDDPDNPLNPPIETDLF